MRDSLRSSSSAKPVIPLQKASYFVASDRMGIVKNAPRAP